MTGSRLLCRCTFVPYGDTETPLTREGCPLHDPDQDEDDQGADVLPFRRSTPPPRPRPAPPGGAAA